MNTYRVKAPDGRTLKITGETPPTEKDLDEMFAKLQPIEQPKQDNILSGIQSEETRAGLREKGKIGVIEELGRGKFLDVIPFANLVTAMERNDTVKNIDKYLKGGKLTDEEQVNIIDYMYEKTEEQERGYTFGGKVAKGYKAMIPFMFEFMGGGAVGKKAVSFLPKAVSKSGKVGTFLAREGARTLAMPQSIYKNFVDRKLEDRVMLSDKGYLALKESDEKPALTTLKALGDVMIENVSESTGEVLFKPIFGGSGKYVGRKLPTGLAKGFKELSEKVTNLPFSKAVKKMGYDGLLEEIGEERLGDLLRFAVNLEGEGYSLESLSKAIPSFDDMMVEAGVIMTWGGTMRGGQYLASKMIKQGTPKAQAEAIVNDMTPQEITDMIQNPPIAEEVSMLEDSYIEARENLKQKMVDVGFDTDGAEDIQKLLDSRVLALSEAVGVAPIDIVNQWGLDIVQSTNEVDSAERNKKIWELVREEGYTPEQAVAEVGKDVLKQDDIEIPTINSEGNPIAKDKQSLDNFNKWFGDSKVVDEDGNPLVVYHGTDAKFNEFKDIGVGRRILGDGFYFSDNIDVAKQHAKRKGGNRIISSYLNFKNPKLLTWEEARNYKKDSLISEGYDGKIVTSLDGKKIYIAFNPNQIKSVKNVGEFSKETGDIYKQDARGQIEFAPDKTTIKLMEKADRSTILHEFGHLFMRDILSYNEKAPNERLVKELKAIRDFVGNDGGDFTVEQQETFARGFEAYLMRGEAPTPQMQGIFDKFKLWLQSVYNSMKELDVKLNKQAINMFDDLFLTQSDIKKKYEVKGKESVEKLFDVQLKLNEIDFDGNKEVKKIKDILDKMLQSNINIDVEFDVEGDIIKDTISLKEAIKQFNQFKKAPKGNPKTTLAQYLRNPNNIAFSRQWVERGLQRKGEFEALGIKTYVKKPMYASSWITSEDTFIQELIDAGYIPQGTELSDTFALDDALYNAEITYATNEKTIDRDLKQANLEGLSETISVLESSLEVNFESFIKQVKNLKSKGFNIVESEQLKEIYKSFKDTVNKKEKLSKLNFDNLAKAKGQINSFITNANLSFKGKADLFKKVSAIKDISQYNERIPKILNYASELIENELKDKQVKFIKKILKSYSVTTDKQGIKRSKLDVGTQKIVNDLIDINSLDINQAEELYLNIGKDEIYSDYELLRNKMITYRFKGFDSPASLLQSLSNDLNKLIELGKTAKTEKDTLNRLNRITEVIDFNMGINRIKADVDTVKTKIANIYRTGFTNIYSALNSVAGKKIADEYGNKLEIGFAKMFTDNYKHDERANKEIAKILNVKENQIAETLIDYGKEDYKLVSKKGVTYKLNKMMIIDIYNAIKQKDIRDDYFEHYNKDDILALIGNLTDKDKALGDYLAKEVQSYYDIMNDAVVDIYGTALPKVKNYWSSSVENVKDINLVSQFELTSQLPSALKSRMGSRVPIPSNAWNKYTSYVTQANYMKNVGREFRDVSLLLNDSSVTRNIINKFGDTVRNNISNLMEGMSLKGIKNIESSLNGIVNTVLNNWVTAKIGLNPSVFVKQLGSITNYAENMPVKEWGKLFLEGLSKPKETVKFMFDNVEYLQARFNQGYSEEITRAIATASKLSAKKQSLTSVMTSLTRFGDIGAIIFGGYPKLKYDLKQGKSIAEAVDSFVLETIKSQQSGLQSSLSVAQQSKNGFMRMLFAFKNTPAQYMRKIADTILQYQNGDISKEQMQKSLVNYLVVQPAIYSWIGSLMVGRFFDDDEEFASFKDLMATLLSQPFSAIPFLDDISKYLASGVVGNKQWKVFNNSFLADIENTLRKTGKDDITIEDLVDIVGTGAELGVGIPVKTVNRWLKRLTGVEE